MSVLTLLFYLEILPVRSLGARGPGAGKRGDSSKLNELGEEGYTSPLEPVNKNQASPAYRLSENSTGLRSHGIRLRRTIS